MTRRLGPARRVAVGFHPEVRGAATLAERLAEVARGAGVEAWSDRLPDPAAGEGASSFIGRLPSAGLLVCVGGDGTVLHASSLAATVEVPIFGVRMGRLGFLTEVTEDVAEEALLLVLERGGRLERRSMVQARAGEAEPVHAINDVVIGRRTLGRTVSVGVRVNGVLLAEYRADAVVVATATGSTGYSLSVNGPILYPTSEEMILVPVAPHLTRANALVIPSTATLSLFVERGEGAMLTVDGSQDRPIESGTMVEVAHSPRAVDFVRLGGEQEFYTQLAQRLGWLRVDHGLGDSFAGSLDDPLDENGNGRPSS